MNGNAIPIWDGDDSDALQLLDAGFKVSRAGIIYPRVKGYIPDVTEWSAIDYLFSEWDYCYDPEFVDA